MIAVDILFSMIVPSEYSILTNRLSAPGGKTSSAFLPITKVPSHSVISVRYSLGTSVSVLFGAEP